MTRRKKHNSQYLNREHDDMTEEQNQVMQRLEKRVSTLEKKNRKLDNEMVQRGKEVTKMIRIFLMVEHMLPEGPKEEFRKVAIEYATRCDKGKGKIDFREATHIYG